MAKLALNALLVASLALLAGVAGERGMTAERPYEDAMYRVALSRDAAVSSSGGVVWSEHPPIAYVLLRQSQHMIGYDIVTLRYVWLATYLVAFCLVLLFAQTGVSCPPDTSGSRAVTWEYVLRAVIVFGAFTSPITLAHATRLEPDAPAYAALALSLVIGGRLLTTPGHRLAAAFGMTIICLAFAHAYGLLVAISMTAVYAVVASCGGPRASRTLPVLAAAATAVVASVALTRNDVAARLDSLVDHYWAQPVVLNDPGIPLAGIWHAGSELAVDGGHLIDLLQAASMGTLGLVVLRARDGASRWAAASTLICVAGFWLWERLVAGEVVIPHWLGLVWVLGFAATARGLSGRPLAAASVGVILAVLLPGLMSVLLSPGHGPECIRRASAEIERLAGTSDPVVFGGTRAYILFAPELAPHVCDRSYVYLREGISPDSFVGRRLIPRDHLIPEQEWGQFATSDRLAIVRLEGAQKVEIPVTGWTVQYRRRFVHPANSIGEVTIELWQRAR